MNAEIRLYLMRRIAYLLKRARLRWRKPAISFSGGGGKIA